MIHVGKKNNEGEQGVVYCTLTINKKFLKKLHLSLLS